ncbi:methyl-accepting chemotaxis protein [Vibrio sp. WJH972]
MKYLGFKNLLLISILALVAISLSIYSYFSYSNESKLLTRMITENTQTYAINQGEKIEAYLQDKIDSVSNIVDELPHNAAEQSAELNIERIMLIGGSLNMATALIGFSNGDGYATFSNPAWVNHRATSDATLAPWYQLALKSNNVQLSNPHTPPGEDYTLISITKQFQGGVFNADLNLDFLSSLVNDPKALAGSVSLVMDEHSQILASSSPSLKVGEFGAKHELIKSELLNTLKEDVLVQEYTLDGIGKLMFSKRIMVGGKIWSYTVGLDKSVAFASLEDARNGAIIFTVSACIISVLVAFFIIQLLYRPILELKRMVLGLSRGDGDLTLRLNVETNDDLGEIAGGINVFIESLQSMMHEIQAASNLLQESVDELNLKSTHNADILQKHARETEQIVTAIEELNSTAESMTTDAVNTAHITEKANESGKLSQETMSQAQQSVTTLVDDVDSTAVSVQTMSDETKGINTILSVIESIAEQTNLLALNAAIEAARAGEHGRGFAVVADEVRNLASRTKDSTLEIETSLGALLKGNQSVVNAMDGTKERCQKTVSDISQVSSNLSTMTSLIVDINELSSQIATASEQQSSVTLETSKNMTAINDMVSELESNGQDALSEATNIASVNHQLVEIVGKFKL